MLNDKGDRLMQSSQGNNSPNLNAGRDAIYVQQEMPIIIDPTELSILITAFFDNIDQICDVMEDTFNEKTRRTNMPKKNVLNGISDAYYKHAIKENSSYFMQIDTYLRHPSNELENDRYKFVSREINRKLTAYKARFRNFDETFEHLSSEFAQTMSQMYNMDFRRKKLVSVFFGYMYFFCDVGENCED